MNADSPDLVALLSLCREQVGCSLRSEKTSSQRVASLAKALHAAFPASPVCACLLRAGTHHVALATRDAGGAARPEWAAEFQALFRRLEAGQDVAEVEGGPRWPRHVVLAEPIRTCGVCAGLVALAVPSQGSSARSGVRLLLRATALQVGACLELEAAEQERQAVADQLAEQAWLANIGELAGPVAHEFNNFLNVVLLHVAILEHEAPERLRADLAEIRHQARNATATVKHLQQYRRRHQPFPRPSDLNRVLREVVDGLSGEPSDPGLVPLLRVNGANAPDGGVPTTLDLAPDLPPVRGSPPDLARLCTFLLTNTARAVSPVGGGIGVRTAAAPESAVLHIEDTGPAVAAELLPHLFDPGLVTRDGTNPLELAACKTLVRRLDGSIQAEARPAGGIAVTVRLPAAAPGAL